ncbi:LysR family transcriptional regulator [Pseudogemmobacter sp. W21_MBD1_M6]|uniref:LysR family transcriptional regulator n=1 Tax=Pseudogemmobacter sp. W21_MBD1_M6 TaxID=3240271 RepID=UPI003F9BCC84
MSAALFEINQLRYFVAVAEELSFRGAAKRLNMTQPPLSRHIAQLEYRLGVMLFDRTNRSVRLTAAGTSFLFDATDILRRAEAAKLAARQAERGEAGAIALGFVPSAAIEVLPRIVSAVARAIPGVHLTLTEMMSYEQVEGLLSGKLDLGITRLPRSNQPVRMTRIYSETFVLALPRTHPLMSLDALCVEDLHDLGMIGYSTERGGFVRDMLYGFYSSRGVVPKEIQAVSQTHSVLALVNEGLGAALVPASSQSMQMANLCYRDIELPDDLRSDLYLATGPKAPTLLQSRIIGIIEAEMIRNQYQ